MNVHAQTVPEGDRTDTTAAGETPEPLPAVLAVSDGVGLGTLMALHKRVRRFGGQLTLSHLAAHCAGPARRQPGT